MSFDGMAWESEHLHWHGLSFSLNPKNPGTTELVLWKTPALIAQYEAFWAREVGRIERVFELGLWKGGSMAFWAEAFRPTRLVGIDQSRESPSAAFDRYVAERADRLRVHWGVDQGNPKQLEELLATEFDGPLDLVIDDASHLYHLTLSSLETLLPRLRPGGLYIIEDWAWHHWPTMQGAFAGHVPLTRLVTELIEAVGTGQGVIADVSVYQGFVAVRRGPVPGPTPFRLTEAISRGAPPSMSLRQTVRDVGREVRARLTRRFVRSSQKAGQAGG